MTSGAAYGSGVYTASNVSLYQYHLVDSRHHAVGLLSEWCPSGPSCYPVVAHDTILFMFSCPVLFAQQS